MSLILPSSQQFPEIELRKFLIILPLFSWETVETKVFSYLIILLNHVIFLKSLDYGKLSNKFLSEKNEKTKKTTWVILNKSLFTGILCVVTSMEDILCLCNA